MRFHFSTVPSWSIPFFSAIALSACGNGSAAVRLEPEAPAPDVVLSEKGVDERVAILNDLLEADLPAKLSGRAEKLAFFKKISPAVVRSMMVIETERKTTLEYLDAKRSGTVTDDLERAASELLTRYRAKSAEDLLSRADIEPLDMLFTQASIESAWGKSTVARDCHNLFGVHAATTSQKCPGHPILAYYPDFTGSIERYMLLLNSGSAFSKFRSIRARNRSEAGENGLLDSNALAIGLLPYSERGQAYVDDVRSGMSGFGLDQVYRDFVEKAY